MIIAGAKGFAKEVLEIFFQKNEAQVLAFFDNVSDNLPNLLYGIYPILKSETDIKEYINKNDSAFCIGVGNPLLREKMALLISGWGGKLCSVISPLSSIGHFGTQIEKGVCIMTGTVITNDIIIREGVLINLNCTIGHDVHIGKYSVLNPGVHISGHCHIGDYVTIGTGAVIIPGIHLGDSAVVAAGAVVTKDVRSKTLVAGVPATLKKELWI